MCGVEVAEALNPDGGSAGSIPVRPQAWEQFSFMQDLISLTMPGAEALNPDGGSAGSNQA